MSSNDIILFWITAPLFIFMLDARRLTLKLETPRIFGGFVWRF